MFRKLVSHNDDLKRLVDKGYAVTIDSHYLVVRDIPYLDAKGALHWGGIVTKLVFEDSERVKQEDHQILFAGGMPHGLDGSPIRNLGGGPHTLALSPSAKDVVVQRSFSNKPRKAQKFTDFFEKIESYVAIISGPAMEVHGVTPYTWREVEEAPEDTVFRFRDTMTSRAEISDLSSKLSNDVVAVIGLGGTGSYLLDFLVRTPVRAVRAFDGDVFHVHNAFRSPGKTVEREFRRPKAEVYRKRYGPFRRRLSFRSTYIDDTSDAALKGVTFAFVCVDKGSARSKIFDLLERLRVPFIDVGMGLKRRGEALTGMARITYFSVEDCAALRAKHLAEESDAPGDLYRTNVQIGELNALNAALAIVKFKQLRGFYRMEEDYKHLLFAIGDLRTAGRTGLDED